MDGISRSVAPSSSSLACVCVVREWSWSVCLSVGWLAGWLSGDRLGTLGDVGISQLFAAAAVSRRTTTRWLGDDTYARIFVLRLVVLLPRRG